MLKRTFIFGLVFSALAVASVVSAQGSENTEMRPIDTVKGRVSFQRRSTIVPMNVCANDRPCTTPQPYWTMVIHSKNALYELDQSFAMGQEKQPDSIVISGMTIRPGAQVLVEGTIETVSAGFGIVSNVRRIDLIMDGRDGSWRDDSNIETVMPMDSVSLGDSGWTCRSDETLGTEFQAQVWYGTALPAPNAPSAAGAALAAAFRMRLLTKLDNGTMREVLRSDDVGLSSQNNDLVYRATASDTVAELQIHQSDEAFFDLPSLLRVTKARKHILTESPGADTTPTPDAQIVLKCTRTQNF